MDGEVGGFSGWLKGHLTLVALCTVTALAISGALAVATVPDGNGVIHACYGVTAGAGGPVPSPGPNVRVIDPAAGQSCDPAGEAALNFNQQGQQGPVGPAGAEGLPGPSGPAGAAGENGGSAEEGDCPAVVGHVTLSGSPSLSFDACSILRVWVGARGRSSGTKTSGPTEYEITKRTDAVSPKLIKAAAQGTIFKTATIEIYKPGTTTVNQTLKLNDAAISSFKAGLGQVQPTDVLTLFAAAKKSV